MMLCELPWFVLITSAAAMPTQLITSQFRVTLKSGKTASDYNFEKLVVVLPGATNDGTDIRAGPS